MAKKTMSEINKRRECFLRYVFGDDFGNKKTEDFAWEAWNAMAVRGFPIYNQKTLHHSPFGLQEQGREQVAAIAKRIPSATKAAAGAPAEVRMDDAFIGRIEELQDSVKSTRGRKLNGGRLKFGRAQKLLNMYLKYMWCKNNITPPHCPFDNIIISRLVSERAFGERGTLTRLQRQKGHENVRHWTKSDNPRDYRIWLAAARKAIKGEYRSLSEWELVAFSEEVCSRPKHKGTCLCGKGCYREKGC